MNQWVVEFGQSDELVTRIYAGGDDAVKAIRDYATECKAHCRSLVAFAKSVEPRWIPVEERLPEEGVVVLAYLPKQADIESGVYAAMLSKLQTLKGTFSTSFGFGFEATHWMPLPEPPEVK